MLENTGGIMPSRFLKTHYRRGASVLMPEQNEEIRCLKNKVPAYMIVRNYHINKDRVSDIWDDCERLQQSGEYVLADMLPEPSNHDDIVHFKNDPLGPPNISSENHSECDIVSDSKKKKSEGKKSKSKSTLHHKVFTRAYHVSIYAKCRSTPKNVDIRTLCQLTPFKYA